VGFNIVLEGTGKRTLFVWPFLFYSHLSVEDVLQRKFSVACLTVVLITELDVGHFLKTQPNPTQNF
jgi:hypothetical protein